MEVARHALHTSLDHIHRSWSHKQHGDVRVNEISQAEAVEREYLLRTESWETLTFKPHEQRGPRRNRKGGLSEENAVM